LSKNPVRVARLRRRRMRPALYALPCRERARSRAYARESCFPSAHRRAALVAALPARALDHPLGAELPQRPRLDPLPSWLAPRRCRFWTVDPAQVPGPWDNRGACGPAAGREHCWSPASARSAIVGAERPVELEPVVSTQDGQASSCGTRLGTRTRSYAVGGAARAEAEPYVRAARLSPRLGHPTAAAARVRT
jgi:hypothetical protein